MRRSTKVPVLGIAVLALVTGCLGGKDDTADPGQNADAKNVTLKISTNAILGGKNAAEAEWITNWVIPKFTEQMKSQGVTAKVEFVSSGTDDEKYKTKLALDLRTQSGADVVAIDGIWFGEFADAGYIKPLSDLVGADADSWDGWKQIPETVQQIATYNGKRYGVPGGTDGRVLFYNKSLFTKAGLPADWQPTSWDDVISAGEKLKASGVPAPIQLNAGTAMGEATTMQGVLPLLVGTGKELYDPDSKKWQGATPEVKQVLELYKRIYDTGLGDKTLQKEAKGRDKSFANFASGKTAILLEGDYFWRSVIEPKAGIAPMKDRDTAVGYAKIPAVQPGKGVRGQDFVSMSGGGGQVINPNTKYPKQAWELVKFMNSPDAQKAFLQSGVRITARNDVNEAVLAQDPMLSYVSKEVLPLTATRPGLAKYPSVSLALQQATADIIAGKSPDEAAKTYQSTVSKAVGGDANIATG